MIGATFARSEFGKRWGKVTGRHDAYSGRALARGMDRLGERALWALRIRLRVLANEEVLHEKLRMVI